MKRILVLFGVFLMALLFASCGDSETATDAQDDNDSVAEDDAASDEAGIYSEEDMMYKAERMRTFYISNPTGTHKSKKVKFTSKISSGSGVLQSMGFFDETPVFIEIFDIHCSGKTCTYTKTLPGCKNYGTMEVDVWYTGTVAPKLTYWFTDC